MKVIRAWMQTKTLAALIAVVVSLMVATIGTRWQANARGSRCSPSGRPRVPRKRPRRASGSWRSPISSKAGCGGSGIDRKAKCHHPRASRTQRVAKVRVFGRDLSVPQATRRLQDTRSYRRPVCGAVPIVDPAHLQASGAARGRAHGVCGPFTAGLEQGFSSRWSFLQSSVAQTYAAWCRHTQWW